MGRLSVVCFLLRIMFVQSLSVKESFFELTLNLDDVWDFRHLHITDFNPKQQRHGGKVATYQKLFSKIYIFLLKYKTGKYTDDGKQRVISQEEWKRWLTIS